jgi:hypothetical protein
VPLRFAPHQSYFVVFRQPPRRDDAAADAKNFPRLHEVAQLDGPWDVAFDPALGGPPEVIFHELTDWSRRTEPGIKHYSGIATYGQTFDLPASVSGAKHSLLLDLGVVHSMARVRVNGHDLGILWCAPWSVEISAVVQPTGNQLEIDVANLWPNRLIGDKALPPDEQVGWTTFNPYQADSPLLPSGLLGPVTLQLTDTTPSPRKSN